MSGFGGHEMNAAPLPPISRLLRATIDFYRRNLRIVLLVAFPVVAIVDVTIGAGLGELTASVHKKLPTADGYIDIAGSALVTVPLVSSILGRAVVIERASGERPTARRAAEEGLELFAPVLLAWILFACAVALGLAILIAPGIYVLIAGYFVVQAVVVDGQRGTRALRTSFAVVRGRWWYSAGVIICFGLLERVVLVLVSALAGLLANAVNSYAVYVVGDVVTDTAVVPFSAIGITLCYLELRKDRGTDRPA